MQRLWVMLLVVLLVGGCSSSESSSALSTSVRDSATSTPSTDSSIPRTVDEFYVSMMRKFIEVDYPALSRATDESLAELGRNLCDLAAAGEAAGVEPVDAMMIVAKQVEGSIDEGGGESVHGDVGALTLISMKTAGLILCEEQANYIDDMLEAVFDD